MYTNIGFRLAGAHATTGRDTAAVMIWERTLQEITEQNPQSKAIPEQNVRQFLQRQRPGTAGQAPLEPVDVGPRGIGNDRINPTGS